MLLIRGDLDFSGMQYDTIDVPKEKHIGLKKLKHSVISMVATIIMFVGGFIIIFLGCYLGSIIL